jgi:tetratricopeptide (TPR) repeat protein
MIFMREGLNPVWKQSVLLAASLALIAQIGVEAANKTVKKSTATTNDALTLYAQKNYLAASQAFYRKVSANPQDADSYYYMGNCAVALKNFPQALQYYKRATDISPDSPTGLASKQATDRVNELMNPKAAAADSAPGKAKVLGDDDEAADKDNKDNKDNKKDPRLVAAEAQGDAKIAAADKAAKKILDDATAQCKQYKDDEERDVNDAAANQPRLAGTDAGNQIANDIRAPYEEKIKNIMDPAKKKAQALKDAAKKEADAIKAAVSLSKK